MGVVKLVDLGIIEYSEAWDKQKEYFNVVTESVDNENFLLYCEHPHVYTLGKSGERENLLIGESFLKKIGATFYKTDRGGDITYHGYGQLVGYPIINISDFNIGLREYIYRVEQAVIDTIKHWGIDGYRVETATGVWTTDSKGEERKICALGVKASRFVTMHGFALNVNTDLNYFSYINPCGFTQKGVCSIKDLCGGEDIDLGTVKQKFSEEFAKQFGCEVNKKNIYDCSEEMDSQSPRGD